MIETNKHAEDPQDFEENWWTKSDNNSDYNITAWCQSLSCFLTLDHDIHVMMPRTWTRDWVQTLHLCKHYPQMHRSHSQGEHLQPCKETLFCTWRMMNYFLLPQLCLPRSSTTHQVQTTSQPGVGLGVMLRWKGLSDVPGHVRYRSFVELMPGNHKKLCHIVLSCHTNIRDIYTYTHRLQEWHTSDSSSGSWPPHS